MNKGFASRSLLMISCIVLAVVTYGAGTVDSHAASVTVAWDPITDTSVTGVRVYISNVSGQYDKVNRKVCEVARATNQCTVTGMVVGTRYFFVATAYTGAAESEFSNEVSYTPLLSAPVIRLLPAGGG